MIWHVYSLQFSLAEQKAQQNALWTSKLLWEKHKIAANTGQKNLIQTIDSLRNLLTDSTIEFFSDENAARGNPFAYTAWQKLAGSLVISDYVEQEDENLWFTTALIATKDCIDCHKQWQVGARVGLLTVSQLINPMASRDNPILKTTVLLYSAIAIGLIMGVVLMLVKQKQYHDELARLTTTDPLTGLFNKIELLTSLKREMEKVKRGASPFCLMLFDIQDFKKINDTLGHIKADELLRDIGRQLPRCIRPFDIPCRLSGDEFALVLPGCEKTMARQIGERIVDMISHRYPKVVLRLGVTQYDGDKTTSIDSIIAQAQSGKN